jgi:hypothetical protein
VKRAFEKIPGTKLNPLGFYSPPLATQHAYVIEYIHKTHNVTALPYHFIFSAKYRRAVFDDYVDDVVKEVWLEIEE